MNKLFNYILSKYVYFPAEADYSTRGRLCNLLPICERKVSFVIIVFYLSSCLFAFSKCPSLWAGCFPPVRPDVRLSIPRPLQSSGKVVQVQHTFPLVFFTEDYVHSVWLEVTAAARDFLASFFQELPIVDPDFFLFVSAQNADSQTRQAVPHNLVFHPGLNHFEVNERNSSYQDRFGIFCLLQFFSALH